MKTVTMTDTVRPPIIARANGAYCSLPASSARAIGIMPRIVANEVIRTGRKRTRQAGATASSIGMPAVLRDRVNSTMRMQFETTIPVIMMTPIRDMTFSVVWVIRRKTMTPVDSRWNGQQDNQRIDEGSELRHQDQVDEHDREDQADTEAREGSSHAFHRAAHRDAEVFGNVVSPMTLSTLLARPPRSSPAGET